MVRTLFKREILSSAFFARKGRRKISLVLSSLLFVGVFVALICFVYYRLYDQLRIYADFNRAFYNFILFFVFVLGIVFALPTMHKTFFGNEKERIILGSRPVSHKSILIAKFLFSLMKNSLFLVVTYLPLSFVFAVQANPSGWFYFLAILMTPFLGGVLTFIGLLLLIPYREASRYIKQYPLLAFVLTIAVSFLLAFVYSLFLGLFVDLIQNSSLDLLFTTARISAMTKMADFLVPTSFLSAILLLEDGMALLYFFVFLVSCSLVSIPLFFLYLAYYYRKGQIGGRRKDYLSVPVHLDSPTKALVKKELSLVLSRSDGFFSFISLVAVEPFLIYLVVSSINVIFSTGNLTFIQSLFPDFLLLVDSLLILLFLSVINSTSSLTLKKEGRNITTMKTIPISPRRQILIKMSVPFAFSSIAYLIALIVLVSTGEIHWVSFLFLVPVGLVFLGVLSLSTIQLDLKRKTGDWLSLLVDFLLPVLFLLVSFVMTLIKPLDQSPYLTFYLSLLVLLVLLSTPLVLLFVFRTDRRFLLFEGGDRT